MTKVAKWKQEAVDELKGLLLEYPVVGVVDMGGMPAKHLQKIRGILRNNAMIKMSKRSIMQHAIEKASTEERSLTALGGYIKGQPAFVFSKINPFKLNKVLTSNRATLPAKPESIAPKDIVITKGETPFPPGPLLGEMQQVGIPAAIAGGKITVKENKVVVRKGEKISAKLASILARLGIEPVEMSLSLAAAHEDGTIFPGELLMVDEAGVVSNLQEAHRQAVNLSVNAAWVTKETAQLILSKAFSNARALALGAGIFEKGIIDLFIARAHAKAAALESVIKESFEAKLKEAGKATGEAKAEGKPEGK